MPEAMAETIAESRRGGVLTTLAVLFGILGVTDILKPLHLEGATTGLVFFGQRLSGTADAIMGPVLGIILLYYAAGIWRMRRMLSTSAMHMRFMSRSTWYCSRCAIRRQPRNPRGSSASSMSFSRSRSVGAQR